MSLRYGDLAKMVWQNAEILRGPYKAEDYGRVIIPLFIMRRIEVMIADTRKQVAEACDQAEAAGKPLKDLQVEGVAGRRLWNRSSITLAQIARSENPKADLQKYIEGADKRTRMIWDEMGFTAQMDKLDKHNLLRRLAAVFSGYELDQSSVQEELKGNQAIGTVYEDLLNLSDSGFTDGAHFTPREIVKLTVDLVIAGDETVGRRGALRSIYDGACGSAGMLAFGHRGVMAVNKEAEVDLYGQDFLEDAIAMSNAEFTMFDLDGDIRLGDTLADDQFPGLKVSYVAMNPPFGVNWEESAKVVKAEQEAGGGRFDPGLPRIKDGSLLFLMHGVSKLQEPINSDQDQSERRQGGRMGIILSGSPLFTGGAGSGESQIRRWLIERDLLECIVMLPGNMFSNTGIQTYLWVLTNDKSRLRRGKVQIIDASSMGRRLRRNQKSRNWEMTTPDTPGPDGMPLGEQSDTARIRRLWDGFDQADATFSRVVPGSHFGYRRITVEQPLKLKIADGDLRAALQEAGHSDEIAGALGARAEAAREGGTRPSELMKALGKIGKELGLKPKELEKLGSVLLERDDSGEVQLDKNGRPVPDPELRDTEDVPLLDSIEAYMAREVLPHTPEAWVSDDPKHSEEVPEDFQGEKRGKIGYEFKLGQFFPKPREGRSLPQVEQELRAEIIKMHAALQPLMRELGLDQGQL